MHDLFSTSGSENIPKFGRKRILCAIQQNDFEKGRQIFSAMPAASQKDPLTSYLMFRLALLSWDRELGQQCLENLSNFSDEGQCTDMLYACIKEAQHAGDKICTLEAMKAITRSTTVDGSVKGNCPSLLRCMIRLIIMMEESAPEAGPCRVEDSQVADDLCAAFEKGEHNAFHP